MTFHNLNIMQYWWSPKLYTYFINMEKLNWYSTRSSTPITTICCAGKSFSCYQSRKLLDITYLHTLWPTTCLQETLVKWWHKWYWSSQIFSDWFKIQSIELITDTDKVIMDLRLGSYNPSGKFSTIIMLMENSNKMTPSDIALYPEIKASSSWRSLLAIDGN